VKLREVRATRSVEAVTTLLGIAVPLGEGLEQWEGGGVERVQLCEELDGTREGGGARQKHGSPRRLEQG
jgi:hypothetical protein